jgi:hypothetical protein
LSTPSSSPRGAIPTHSGSWGILKEAAPYPTAPNHRGASFCTYPRERAIIGQDQASALTVVPEGPCQRLRGLMPHKYTGVQRCNQTKVEPQPACIMGYPTTTAGVTLPSCIPSCINTLPTLGNGFCLPTFAKVSIQVVYQVE